MQDLSERYYAAITGDARRVLLRAVIDIIDPDIVYGSVHSESAASCSRPDQLHDKVIELSPPYATLERNRWLLDGSFAIVPDRAADIDGEIGYVSQELSGEDGTFSPAQYVELQFSGVTILQACSVYFPGDDWDGVPDTFTVEVLQGGTAYETKTVSENREQHISLTGFTVNNPDAIRITVTKWSLPGRRMRVPEIVPGIYEIWDNDIIASFGVTQQVNFSCLALPYGTCTLSMDNLDRRFEPRNKAGLFQSIEERQGVDVSIGVEEADGSPIYQHVGVFYQFSGGWKTGDNGLTMQWDLVDIIGLLADRQYLAPDTLPTTLGGWIASLVGQLGTNFAGRYTVDPNFADLPLTADKSSVSDRSCGEILLMACMATGTFPRAAAETGHLAVEPYWYQGTKITLDNLESYPVIRANNDLAVIIFTLADGSGTQYVVSGNSTASSQTVQVDNPFLHTQAEALTAARLILSTYGGNQIETTGRGNPASELGDVDTVWLNESSATTGRRMYQTFTFSDGVMQGCQSTLLQADGSFLFEERVVITEGGSWTAPAGVTQLRLILVGGGTGGTSGADGTWDSAGADGVDGSGGHVWAATVGINPQQTFQVSIGQGGVEGQPGTATTFGQYSSAEGQEYPYGYTDIASGDSFARTGVKAPLSGSGDGGAKGLGGIKGNRHRETETSSDGTIHSYMVVDNYPGEGEPGTAGVSGCVVIYWDKEAET